MIGRDFGKAMPESMVQRLRVHHHGVCIATHENKVTVKIRSSGIK